MHQGSTGVELPRASGPRKLFIAGSRRVRSDRTKRDESEQSKGIIQKTATLFPARPPVSHGTGTAASYATRAIMNDEIASRSRSDTNFPERRGNEIFIEQLISNGNAFRSFRSGNAVLYCIYLHIQHIHYHLHLFKKKLVLNSFDSLYIYIAIF